MSNFDNQQLVDWCVAALERCGIEHESNSENVRRLYELVIKESGADPSFTYAYDEPEGWTYYGVSAVSKETWDDFNPGGNIFDPVANLMCCINYQLFKYGKLIDWNLSKEQQSTTHTEQ